MDDIQGKLAEILGDEDSMRRVQALAQQLLGENQPEAAPTPDNKPSPSLTDIGSVDMGRLIGLVSKFQSRGEDDRTRLLLALKPHLRSERAKRVDTAVKLLKLIDLLPLLKEADLFSGIF